MNRYLSQLDDVLMLGGFYALALIFLSALQTSDYLGSAVIPKWKLDREDNNKQQPSRGIDVPFNKFHQLHKLI